MAQENIILQKSPKIEIAFYQDDFEVQKSESVLIEKTSYIEIKKVEFVKERIPWFTGIFTTLIDLLLGSGLGVWNRDNGNLKLTTNTHDYSIELVRYDKEQTSIALKMINLKQELIKLNEFGESVFGNKTSFESWLTTKSKDLGKITPESLLKNADGIQNVKDAMGRIEHGIFS